MIPKRKSQLFYNLPVDFLFIRVLSLFILLTIISSDGIHAQNTFYYNAYKHWSPQLEKEALSSNNPIMLTSVGSCYDRGDGISQNRKKALEFFEKSAALNDMLGLYNLAYYYYKGYGVNKDFNKALNLYQQSLKVDKDFLPAYNGIAQLYNDGGFGLHADYSKAAEYYLEASNRKDVYATYVMGIYNLKNRLADANINTAINYFEKCKNLDPKFLSAYIELAEIFLHGKGVDKDLDRAMNNLNKEIELGFYEAYQQLASCYIEKGDYEKAAENLLSGYEKGQKSVIHNLADCYYFGNGVPQSYEKAFELFNEGARSNPLCNYRLAVMFREGLGVTQDNEKYLENLVIASNNAIPQAQYLLGLEKYEGNLIKQDYAEAVNLLTQALESKFLQQDVKADICRKLAACYRFGRGVKRDENKADAYTNIAATYGDPDAKKIQNWLNTKIK